ncbi:hypothetical protein BC567DRAFT_237955 [Phyllosticta citribraziliensis]
MIANAYRSTSPAPLVISSSCAAPGARPSNTSTPSTPRRPISWTSSTTFLPSSSAGQTRIGSSSRHAGSRSAIGRSFATPD